MRNNPYILVDGYRIFPSDTGWVVYCKGLEIGSYRTLGAVKRELML